MSGLNIEISPGSTYAGEGEFGLISCNGMDNFPNGGLKDDQTQVRPSVLSYPILRMEALGQGSSSIVYKSVMLQTLRVTAEKVFIIHDTQKRLQLFRELESLKSLCNDDHNSRSCPFLVNLLAVFSNPADGTLSMCLDYMDCGSLQHLVNRGGCANETVLASIAYQMTAGLKFLHSKRLIHRDVKPSNALISSSGCIKLADFGLARTLDSGESLVTSFVGTFLYMAPERLTGESYSFQSDIWSLGLTIHAVAMGSFPYANKTGYWEVLHATQQGPPPFPSTFSAHLRTFLSLSYLDVSTRASAEALLAHPFISSALDLIPEQLRSSVCVAGPPELPAPTEDPVMAQANKALAAKLKPTSEVSTTASPSLIPATSSSKTAMRKVASHTISSNRSSSNTRTPVTTNSANTRRVAERFGTSNTPTTAAKQVATASSQKAQLARKSTGTAPVRPAATTQQRAVAVSTRAPTPSVVAPLTKKTPYVRSVSAVGIKTSNSHLDNQPRGQNSVMLNNPPVPHGDRPKEFKHLPFGPIEITKLVNSWIDYANQARIARDSNAPPSLPPTEPVQDSFNYAVSPSAAVNSLRRLVSRQHDAHSVQVTEEVVLSLAAALHCDKSLLLAEFKTAMKLVNQEFRSSQVNKIRSSTAPVANSFRLSTEEPVRTLGEARRSMRLAAGQLASELATRTEDFSMARMSTEFTRAADISTLSAPPTHRPGSPFLSSPLLGSPDFPVKVTPSRAEPSLSPVPAAAESDEEDEILDDEIPGRMSRARSDLDLLEESICEEIETPVESPRAATSRPLHTLSAPSAESDDDVECNYADESFEDFQD